VEVILFLGDSYGTLNPGAGLTFWFTDNVGLELATRYKKIFGEREEANGTQMLHHIFNIQLV
jgi:hypothetical protein